MFNQIEMASHLSLQLPVEAISVLSDSSIKPCVFIKSQQHQYLFTNQNFEIIFDPCRRHHIAGNGLPDSSI